MRTGHVFTLCAASMLLAATVVMGQTGFADSTMRRNAAQRIAKNHRVNVDWRKSSLLELTDIEARLNAVSRIKRNHGVSFDMHKSTLLELVDAEARLNAVKRIERTHSVRFDWEKATLLQLTDAEARMNISKRLTTATGKNVDWKDYTLMQFTEAEAKLRGVDQMAVKNQVAGKARQDKGAASGVPVYITKIDEDKDGVLMLTNGGTVEITRGFLGFVGFRKDAVLFKSGTKWKIWIEGKKVYDCDTLKAPSGSATGSGQLVSISEVKGNGKILMMLDGSIYEVDDLNTIDTALWLGNSDGLLIDETRLINFDDADEIVDVTKLK